MDKMIIESVVQYDYRVDLTVGIDFDWFTLEDVLAIELREKGYDRMVNDFKNFTCKILEISTFKDEEFCVVLQLTLQ